MRLIDADKLKRDLVIPVTLSKDDADKLMLKIIDEQPTIDAVEVKHGKWENVAGNQKCSECGMSFPDLYPLYDNASYCPNCGAKMEKGKNYEY